MPPITVSEATPPWPVPQIKLRIDDLDHEGVEIFLNAVNPKDVLRRAILASFKWLYTPETAPPSVEEILLILRPMGGVAHTMGSDTHKEIHFSLDYIVTSQNRAEDEITGVLVHEVVHCFQYDSNSTCPAGLVEGIADYVRLNEGFAPPHWRKSGGDWCDWDAGYDTTAYFLDWIEKKHGEGTIRKLNQRLKDGNYTNDLFRQITGADVDGLWNDYSATLGPGNGDESFNPKPEAARMAEPLKTWPVPKFHIRVEDIDHEGVDVFYGAIKLKDALHEAVMASFNCLYTLETVPTNVKQILLVLRPMDGVAYTTGSSSHKEIHFSLDYIKGCESRARDEIMGVLVHEVVHCYQYDGRGTCPGGLTEGIADFVRLRENLDPPHWQETSDGSWDAGYDTTAYFLHWIESSAGKDTVQKLNRLLKQDKYTDAIFTELTGTPVDELWANYSRHLEGKADGAEESVRNLARQQLNN
ncbi:hypothetical protein GALMADRAFT_218662 [Galerina marginata CBS 339.88]|uniref:Plant basic secretory protein n=1 Tax=Galerina marginata (strain CBS 339.88) TaxID=685588 RepID=A0A067TQT9_GALM3|nr:hypothetical protein GALMADRAFT_218662 [Galerina marginata CBS 339.88]